MKGNVSVSSFYLKQLAALFLTIKFNFFFLKNSAFIYNNDFQQLNNLASFMKHIKQKPAWVR